MLQVIRNMESVTQLCRAHEPLPEPLAQWLAESLKCFLNRSAPSLEEAFGLPKLRGGVSWRMEAAIRRRDQALRELAQRHFGGLTNTARANRIQQLALRYAASAWRLDRDQQDMPSAYAGTPHESLWHAFKSGATMPLCSRQLRQILADLPTQ